MDCHRLRLWRKTVSLLFLRSDSLPVPMVTGDWHFPGYPLSFCHEKHHLTRRQICISPPCRDVFWRERQEIGILLNPFGTLNRDINRFSVQFFRDRLYQSRVREGWARCSAFSTSSYQPVLAFLSALLFSNRRSWWEDLTSQRSLDFKERNIVEFRDNK